MTWSLNANFWEKPQGPSSIRRGLAALVLVSALPFVVFSAFLLVWVAQSQRETLMAQGEQSVRSVVNSLDQEVARANSLLRGVSSSRQLQAQNFAQFSDQIASKLPPNGSYVLLYDVKAGTFLGRRGEEPGLHKTPQQTMRETAETGRMQVSGVFLDTALSQFAVLVTEPMFAQGEISAVLGLIMPAARINDILQAQTQALPQGWISAVFDGAGLTVARTHGGLESIGKPVRPDLLQAIQQKRQGWMENVTREGVDVQNVFASTASGWSIAIGIPLTQFNQPIVNSLLLTSAIGILLATLALLLALIVSSYMAEPIAGLANAARDLGNGEKPRRIPSSIRELSVVQAALEEAYVDLCRKDAERSRAEEEVRDSEERLRLALEAGGLGTWEYEPYSKAFRTSSRCKAIFGFASEHPFTYDDLLAAIHPEDRERQRQAVLAAIAQTANFSVEYRIVHPDSSLHWARVDGNVVGGANGAVKLVGVSQDITRQKTAEELQTLLLGELNHRVKNSLAQIVAIAHFTRRSQGETTAAWDALENRIHAMAKTHDLLTASDWRGGKLRDVLWNELAPYQDAGGERLSLTGEPVALTPKATLALGLAAHELATNAAKYGALSVPEGRVNLSWAVERIGASRHVVLRWTEIGGPPVATTEHKGFGSRLIEQVFARELRGTVRLLFAPGGVQCHAIFPLEEQEAAVLFTAQTGASLKAVPQEGFPSPRLEV